MDYHKVETPIGPMWIYPTQGNHLCASNGRNALNGDRTSPDVHPPFLIRGVEICISAHFYKHSDGTWRIGDENKSEHEVRESLYASRLGSGSIGDASESARKKIVSVIVPIVQEWVSKNGEAIKEADITHTERQIEKAAEECKELRAKLKDAEGRCTSLLAHLKELVK